MKIGSFDQPSVSVGLQSARKSKTWTRGTSRRKKGSRASMPKNIPLKVTHSTPLGNHMSPSYSFDVLTETNSPAQREATPCLPIAWVREAACQRLNSHQGGASVHDYLHEALDGHNATPKKHCAAPLLIRCEASPIGCIERRFPVVAWNPTSKTSSFYPPSKVANYLQSLQLGEIDPLGRKLGTSANAPAAVSASSFSHEGLPSQTRQPGVVGTSRYSWHAPADIVAGSSANDPGTAASSCSTTGIDGECHERNPGHATLAPPIQATSLSTPHLRIKAQKRARCSPDSGLIDVMSSPFSLFAHRPPQGGLRRGSSLGDDAGAGTVPRKYSDMACAPSDTIHVLPGLPGRKSPRLDGIWSTKPGSFVHQIERVSATAGGSRAGTQASPDDASTGIRAAFSPLEGPTLNDLGTGAWSEAATQHGHCPRARTPGAQEHGGRMAGTNAQDALPRPLHGQYNVFRTASWDSLGV